MYIYRPFLLSCGNTATFQTETNGRRLKLYEETVFFNQKNCNRQKTVIFIKLSETTV